MTPAQTQQAINAITTADLHRLPAAINRARAWAADGYPRSSLGGNQPGTVLDDQGYPMPPRTDPTGELVVALDEGLDPVAADIADILEDLREAAYRVNRVVAFIGRTHQTTHHLSPSRTAGCSNCKTYGHFATVYARGVCSWCADVRATFGKLPNSVLVDRHARGIRLYANTIAAELGVPTPSSTTTRDSSATVRDTSGLAARAGDPT